MLFRSLREHAAEELSRAEVPSLGAGERLVGIGGTVRNLAKIELRRSEHPLPVLHGFELQVDRLDKLADQLASRSMRHRAQLPGLNPDRADSILGGALVVLEVMDRIGAERLLVSSRGLREGLALGDETRLPSPRWVRTISVATLGARFATWDPKLAERRAAIATRLHDTLEPEARDAVREMLVHGATLLDIGRAIDYYDRFEHAAMIVTAADLAGFTHEALGILTAILRQADEDLRLGSYRRLIAEDDRGPVLRAAATLALADQLNRRIPPEEQAAISCTWHPGAFVVVGAMPSGWQSRGLSDRFRHAFDRPLHVVSTTAAPWDGRGPDRTRW